MIVPTAKRPSAPKAGAGGEVPLAPHGVLDREINGVCVRKQYDLAIRIHFCRPRDPEAKGLVGRANGYLGTSFLPDRVFTGPGDFNGQLTAWLQVANRQRPRRIDAHPVDRWEADRSAMLALPPVAPPNWWPRTIRLGRDHYIRVDTCDYSVHPRAIRHRITVRSDTESIVVTCGNDVVARHGRCWSRHQTITNPEHAVAARHLRDQARPPVRTTTALSTALAMDDLGIEVEQRALVSAYKVTKRSPTEVSSDTLAGPCARPSSAATATHQGFSARDGAFRNSSQLHRPASHRKVLAWTVKIHCR
ncbi:MULTISPECIES: Mu transposase domain-containing protein [unclassified Streptomyces]|uniref:Mu transposase domain-containing protein n=1 Tax=unclassified Streptomyces TaxID=2593676 RepID=UPI00382311C1